MIQRARLFFQEAETSVAITVGVVGGLALYYVFNAIGYGFVLPILRDHLSRNHAIDFTVGGVTFDYQQLTINLTSLLLISAVGYVLFVWRTEAVEVDPDTRDCPECKSEIWIDARRCPYCTSMVTPLAEPQDAP